MSDVSSNSPTTEVSRTAELVPQHKQSSNEQRANCFIIIEQLQFTRINDAVLCSQSRVWRTKTRWLANYIDTQNALLLELVLSLLNWLNNIQKLPAGRKQNTEQQPLPLALGPCYHNRNNMTLPTLTLDQWDARYEQLRREGLREPFYGGPLRRHVDQGGDHRISRLRLDGSAAALRLWNFLLTENERLHAARASGEKIVGTMKDLGTVPVMAYSLSGVRAFYPDGAWWTPCIMECGDRLLEQAEALGIDASFCPVRAMIAAFENGEHFPEPDLLICSAGAICDDFSAIAQRLEHLGSPY